MSTFSNSECWETPVAASGTVTLPSNWGNITDGDDYDVVCVEGVGSLDEGTKTATDFDVTTTGAAVFRVYPRKIGVITQVS